jgi:biotin carboxyl carrier protein
MTLIGAASVFACLAIVAATCVALKRFFKEGVEEPKTAETIQAEKIKTETIKEIEKAKAFRIKINGEEHEVKVEDKGSAGKGFEEIAFPGELGEEIKVVVDAEEFNVKIEGTKSKAVPITEQAVERREKAIVEAKTVVKAPMYGKIVKLPIKVGEKVEKGTVVIVLETMKMENAIESPVSGIVKEIRFSEGDVVNADDVIVVID